jgi:hypothetical protein
MGLRFTIGSLNKSVTFKKNARGSLGAGSKAEYVPFLTTRCNLEKKRAIKNNDRGQIEITAWYRLVCRFQATLLNELSNSTICEIDGEMYTMHDFELIDQRRHLYEFVISKARRNG